MPDWVAVVLGVVAGLIAGSFIATLVLRWPRGLSLAGRSRCDGCGATLRVWELAPMVSFIALRGKCARCAAPIDARHPIVEAACAAIGGAALFVAPGWAGAAGALFGWMLLALALLDVEHQWLPDRLTLPLLALGLAAGAVGIAPSLLDRAIGAVTGFASLALIAFAYRQFRGREGLGGGDPKLFGAIGAWLGWQALPIVLLLASLIGLGSLVTRRLRGEAVAATDRLPLGALLAVAAFPLWLVEAGLR